MKNLLLLSWRDIRHPKAGGAEVFTHEMFKRLDLNTYKITHISPKSTSSNGAINLGSEFIDGINYIRKGNNFTVILYAFVHYMKRRKTYDYVIDQCNTHRFFTPFWVGKSKRIFFIHQMTREIWQMNLPKAIGWFGMKLESFMTWIYRHSAMVLTVSDSTKDDLAACGIPEEKIHILPEGINFEPWNTSSFLVKDSNLFTYVGRYSSYKGIDKAVEAFCRTKLKYPDIKLQIIGKKKDDYIQNVLLPIMEKYNTSKEDIRFLGFVSEEEKLIQMSRSRALLFPSLREGWGLTVTEGAAVGTPSIVYDSPGLRDAVDHGNAGFVTLENNVFGLEALMVTVLSDEAMYLAKREQAHRFAFQFNWKHTAESFMHII